VAISNAFRFGNRIVSIIPIIALKTKTMNMMNDRIAAGLFGLLKGTIRENFKA